MSLSSPSRTVAFALALSIAAPLSAQCDIAKLLPVSEPSPDYFGHVVDLHGALAVVGEAKRESAFLFDISTGTEIGKLQASDSGFNQLFGQSVATDGQWIVVGSPRVDSFVGAAYLFDAATGVELFKLSSPSLTSENAGSCVDIQGGIVLVAALTHDWKGTASGAVHLYSATTGQYIRRLLAHDGGPWDRFGLSAALEGPWIVVGAPGHDDHFGNDSGAAYVFDAVTGKQLHELLPGQAVAKAEFGWSVAVHGDVALVGAPGNDAALGQAFAFDLTTGEELHRWSTTQLEGLGYTVAIEDSTVLVGAYLNDAQAANGGAVHRFDLESGELVDLILPTDAQSAMFFSRGSIAISEGRALVSAAFYKDSNGNRGTAYLYSLATEFGSGYCPPSTPNSVGRFGRVSPGGCDAVLANDLTLVAGDLPPERVGYFLASQTQGFVPGVGGSQGNLCLGGNLARFVTQAASSGSLGEIPLAVDLTAIPTSPPSSVVVGETWSFQCWYRDRNPGPTSNLTSGLAILFR